MPILYNGSKIIPAPFITFSKEYVRGGDGGKIGATFNITVTGKISVCQGSPTSSGTFWQAGGNPPQESIPHDERLKAILHKQDALRNLFADEGKAFEVQPLDDSAPMKFHPRVTSINFPEGLWIDTADYTIEMQADEILGYPGQEDHFSDEDYFTDEVGNKLFLQSAEENWSLEIQEDPLGDGVDQEHSYLLTHNVSAVGKHSYGDDSLLISPAWEQARRWVYPRLGLDNNFLHSTSGLNVDSSFIGYNQMRSENTDERGGSYSVNENWFISNADVVEEFVVETTQSIESNIVGVSINGSIRGLETRSVSDYAIITENKWGAASAKFTALSGANTFFSRAQTISGQTLNVQELSSSVGRNKPGGSIDYNYDYDTRPSNCIEGALSEDIVITDTNQDGGIELFASSVVLGRTPGPVLQDLNTTSQMKRGISITVTVPEPTGCDAAALLAASPRADVITFLNDFAPTGDQVFKEQDDESWNPKTGEYSRNVSYTYQSC